MDRVTLILASASPRRKELIRQLGLPVEFAVNNADEWVQGNLPPEQVVERLAERKARAAYETIGPRENAVVVAGDTIVVFGGEILGKPKDEDDAFRMLCLLQGKTHAVYSGISCIACADGKVLTGHSRTFVTMKPLSDAQIRRYIRTGEPMDKAGAYAIQGLGSAIVEKIEGDYFTVVGLPLAMLADMLAQLGVRVL